MPTQTSERSENGKVSGHTDGGPQVSVSLLEREVKDMTAQQIEKFIDAGYTKEEINLLFKDPKVDPAPENVGNGKNDNEEDKNAQDPGKDTTDKNVEKGGKENFELALKGLSDSIAELKETVKAMQDENIKNARTDSIDDNSDEKIMRSFIEKL